MQADALAVDSQRTRTLKAFAISTALSEPVSERYVSPQVALRAFGFLDRSGVPSLTVSELLILYPFRGNICGTNEAHGCHCQPRMPLFTLGEFRMLIAYSRG